MSRLGDGRPYAQPPAAEPTAPKIAASRKQAKVNALADSACQYRAQRARCADTSSELTKHGKAQVRLPAPTQNVSIVFQTLLGATSHDKANQRADYRMHMRAQRLAGLCVTPALPAIPPHPCLLVVVVSCAEASADACGKLNLIICCCFCAPVIDVPWP